MKMCIRHIFSLMVFNLILTTVSAELKFGCEFYDKNFNTREVDDLPTFGSAIRPAVFFSESALDALIEEITKIISQVTVTNVFNTVDSITEFYKTYLNVKNKYKKNTPEKVKKHLEEFRPVYNPDSENTGWIVKVMTEIRNQLPYIKDSIYFTTAYVNADYDTICSLDTHSGTPPPNFKHNHIAGVLKFMLMDQLGYVFFDPEYAVSPPIKIMENSDDKVDNAANTRTFFMWPVNRNYMMSYRKTFANATPLQKILYYVERPMCSIMKQAKDAILHNHRSITQRNAQLFPSVQIFFYLFPKVETPEFTIVKYKMNSNEIYSLRSYFFKDYFKWGRMAENTKYLFMDTINYSNMSITPEGLYKIMRASHSMLIEKSFIPIFEQVVAQIFGNS